MHSRDALFYTATQITRELYIYKINSIKQTTDISNETQWTYTDNNLVSTETSKEKLLQPQQINSGFKMLLISSGITKFILFHRAMPILHFSLSRLLGRGYRHSVPIWHTIRAHIPA